jgi:hypothetical protein
MGRGESSVPVTYLGMVVHCTLNTLFVLVVGIPVLGRL